MCDQAKQIVRNRDMYVNSCDRPCPLCTTRVRQRAPPACARHRAPALAWDTPGVYRKRPVPGFITTGHTPCSRIESAKIAPLQGQRREEGDAQRALPVAKIVSLRRATKRRERRGDSTRHQKPPHAGRWKQRRAPRRHHPSLNSTPHKGRCQKRRAPSRLCLPSKSAPCGALGVS
jgi:hypothetical protein